MKQKPTAKDKHRVKLLKYLRDWENPWPNRDQMAKVCGILPSCLRFHFSPDDFMEIENEGIELRKKNAALPRSNAYAALEKQAKEGNVSAIKELLDRTEGKVEDRLKIDGNIKVEIVDRFADGT